MRRFGVVFAVFVLAWVGFVLAQQRGLITVIDQSDEPAVGDTCLPGADVVEEVQDDGARYYCDSSTSTWQLTPVTIGVGDMAQMRSKTDPWYDVTHPDYGADPTCALDSATAIQAAIDAACAATTRSTDETFDNVAAPTVFFPAGEYEVAQRLEVGATCDGVTLTGPGGAVGAGLFFTEAQQGIQVGDGGSNVVNAVTIRDLKLSSNDEATASGCTFNNPAAAGTLMIDAELAHMIRIENVDIWFDEQNVIEGLRGIRLHNTERFEVRNVRVFWTAGNDTATFSAGLEIDGTAGTTRGNFIVDNYWNKWTQVGAYVLRVNNGTFRNFKATNGTEGALAAGSEPLYCFHGGKGLQGIRLEGHCEGEPDTTPTASHGDNDWDVGVFLDADEGGVGAIRSVDLDHMRISRAWKAFHLTGTVVDEVTIRSPYIFNENTVDAVYDLDAGVEMVKLEGLVITAATTVTAVIDDGTALESRDWFGPWNTTGDTQELIYDGDVTFGGDAITFHDGTDTNWVMTIDRAGTDITFTWNDTLDKLKIDADTLWGNPGVNDLTIEDATGLMDRDGSATTTTVLRTEVAGDDGERMVLLADGKHKYGDGSGTTPAEWYYDNASGYFVANTDMSIGDGTDATMYFDDDSDTVDAYIQAAKGIEIYTGYDTTPPTGNPFVVTIGSAIGDTEAINCTASVCTFTPSASFLDTFSAVGGTYTGPVDVNVSSVTAFQVQDGSNNRWFNADSTTQQICLGDNADDVVDACFSRTAADTITFETVAATNGFIHGIGADPGATCTAGWIYIDTDETVDTNCTTTADNSLCLCTATNTWTALENN